MTATPVELPSLTNAEISRYSRHLILDEVGMEGQRKLKNARVLTIGTGGLGSPLGLYLAAAGVGHIGLVDFDVVDESNLQRQIIHGTKDVGRLKTASARDRLSEINPHISIETYETHLTSENALRIFRDYDIVVDGTDNFPTRYLVNDACALLGKPNVYGSIFRFEGQASVFWAARGACYRCLYPEPPPPGLVPSCAEGGVLGVLPGIVGSIQANETIFLDASSTVLTLTEFLPDLPLTILTNALNVLTALSELPRIITLLKKADAAAPTLDDAGPARVLALLLVRAPGWPTGPGNPDDALVEAQKAVSRAPNHPLNHATLAECLAATGDTDGAKVAYRRAIELGTQRGDADGTAWAAQATAALDALK